jgi:hypothetical protein
MSEADRNELYRAFREAIRTGRRVLFLVTKAAGESTVRALLTYAPHTCRKTAGAIKSLESAGIRVAAFLREDSDVSLRALSECGLTENHPPHIADQTPAIHRLDGGVRAFTACDTDYIRNAIEALREQGRTVAVLSVDREDTPLLAAADLAVTCSPSVYASAENGHPCLRSNAASPREPLADRDGSADSVLATDLCRRRADVVVRRTASDGGGVIGLRRAILCADSYKENLRRILGFLLLSQAARLCLTVLPLLLGLATLTAPDLLLSGLGVDLLIILSAAALPPPSTPHKRSRGEDARRSSLAAHRNGLIAVAVATAVPTLIAAVFHYLTLDMGGDPARYLLLCLLGLQTAVYRLSPLPRRERSVFFTTLALVLTYVAALAFAVASGLGLLWTLAMPLLSPVLYLTVKLILDHATREKSKPVLPPHA